MALINDEFAAAVQSCSSREIVELRRAPSAYRTSFPIEDVQLQFKDGTRTDIIFKDLHRGSLDDNTRRAKPEFLHDPMREIETYRDVLTAANLGTPAFYGAVCDES